MIINNIRAFVNSCKLYDDLSVSVLQHTQAELNSEGLLNLVLHILESLTTLLEQCTKLFIQHYC